MQKTAEKRLARSEVPKERTWDLRDLYESEEAFQADLKEIERSLAEISKRKGTLQNSPQELAACLKEKEQLTMKLVRSGTYTHLKDAADGTDPANQAITARYAALSSKADAALSFINSEILEFPEEQLDHFIAEEPELAPFRKTLKDLQKTKKHRLSAETEEALAALGEVHDAPYKIYGLSKSADMQFDSIQDEEGNELPVSFALFETRYEFSGDTDTRRKAYASFVKTLTRYKNTFAATYSTEISKQVTLAKLRNYPSATDMLLEQQKVTPEMYHNQLDTLLEGLSPIMQRFARLKQKVLGLDKMMFCDLKAPLETGFNADTTYEEASKVILEALQVMGPEYVSIMEKGLTERWTDYGDNIGKRTGAFCSSPYGVHPYILITWQDTMRSTFTMAHELGHAGHFYLAGASQRIMNTRPSLYFIEAPSTMNEMLLSRHLLRTTEDPKMKAWVYLQQMGTYYHNFVTHLLEAECQRRVYETAEAGGALTASALSDIKAAVLKDFWGDTVEIDEGASLTWMRQPHYYMGLYSYTYSAGLTVSTAVSKMIEEEGQPAVDKWLDVLKAGGSMDPLDLLNKAGVDMTKTDAFHSAIRYVGSLVDELEAFYS